MRNLTNVAKDVSKLFDSYVDKSSDKQFQGGVGSIDWKIFDNFDDFKQKNFREPAVVRNRKMYRYES